MLLELVWIFKGSSKTRNPKDNYSIFNIY